MAVVADLPELVGTVDVARFLGLKVGSVHSARSREKFDRVPPPDAVVSGTPVWVKIRFTDPGEPIPALPPLLGVKEVAAMFGVDAETVGQWQRRDNVPSPEPVAKIGRIKIWTLGQWVEFARRTNRPIVHPP